MVARAARREGEVHRFPEHRVKHANKRRFVSVRITDRRRTKGGGGRGLAGDREKEKAKKAYLVRYVYLAIN